MKYSCVRLHCVIHKNSLLLNQHNGDDAPQNYSVDVGESVPEKLAPCSIVARAVGKDRVRGSGVTETSATLVEKLRELGVRR